MERKPSRVKTVTPYNVCLRRYDEGIDKSKPCLSIGTVRQNYVNKIVIVTLTDFGAVSI